LKHLSRGHAVKIGNRKSTIVNRRGLFITFEGIEGCGKTTQVRLLAQGLRRSGREVVVTREPGGPAISELIRDILLDARHHSMDPLTELLLLEASRAQHVAEVIAPALRRGAVVLCDRFADSSTAYQGSGRKMGTGMIDRLNRIATGGVWPDLTFVFDLPVAEGFARASRRRRRLDRMESQQRIFHQRVRNGFKTLAAAEPRRVKLIDARREPEAILDEVWQTVARRLGGGGGRTAGRGSP
jgi:dTMP kinase